MYRVLSHLMAVFEHESSVPRAGKAAQRATASVVDKGKSPHRRQYSCGNEVEHAVNTLLMNTI